MNKILILSLHLQYILLNKTVFTQQNYNYSSFDMDKKKCDQIEDVDSCFQGENISKWCDYEKILNLTHCYICEGKEYKCNNNTIHVCSNINNITDICNKNSSNAQSPNESVLYDQNFDYYLSLDYLHIAIIVIVSLFLLTALSFILYSYYKKKRSLKYAIVNTNKV
ncbi:hypothetical protein H311_03587 [Anncaliia algerae PRA109]|nr:hypothetical protein H311_03587 [Anncaliia algerae PRA109]